MWKPAPITTGQAYGACLGWRAYWGSRACGGVRSPYARAPTPLRLNGAGRKEHRLYGVLGIMTLLREGRGCLCPSLPCRLLCRGARDVFPSPVQPANPDRAFTAASSLRSSLCRALSTALPASSDALRLRLRHLLQLVFQVRRQRRCVHDKGPESPETLPELVESSVQHGTSLAIGAQRIGNLPSRTPRCPGADGRELTVM
jgi:hypothetical protein